MYAKKLDKLKAESKQEVFPHHLIAEHILPRLPAKSLCRFKAVCKSWLSTVSSSEFQKTHLKFSSSSPKFLLLLDTSEKSSMFLLPYNESNTTVNDLVELLPDDLAKNFEDFYIVDSCNGVVCLFRLDSEKFSLWNPVTKQYMKVPNYTERSTDLDVGAYIYPSVVGFSYALSINDYKIVAICESPFAPFDGSGYFLLFSQNTGKWRRLDDLDGTYYLSALTNSRSFCIDETMYWPLGNVETNMMIGVVGFDLVHDRMKKVVEVLWLCNYNKVDIIFKMKGCLSLCCRKNENHFADVWMLKEHEVPKTWSKCFSIDCSNLSVFGFTDYGKYLVKHSGQLKLIDPIQQDSDLSKSGADCDYEISPPGYKYVESLAPF